MFDSKMDMKSEDVEYDDDVRPDISRSFNEDKIAFSMYKQDSVQKKTFTKWINSFLEQSYPSLVVDDLFEDIKNGVMLLTLLEVLTGVPLPIERKTGMKRLHFISNLTTALKFLESRNIKLVNINPTDIADGKPAIVLGLVWTIILFFQIEEHTRLLERYPARSSFDSCSSLNGTEDTPKMVAAVTSPVTKVTGGGGARKVMLQWVQKAVDKCFGVEIQDFGPSWRDGVAFSALIHGVRPELVDMSKVSQSTPRANLENAFTTAEQHLGIPKLLDPEDVDVDKPDERSIMTYIAKFLEKFPDSEAKTSKKKKVPTATLR